MHISQCFEFILQSSFVWPSLLHLGHHTCALLCVLFPIIFIFIILITSSVDIFNSFRLLFFGVSSKVSSSFLIVFSIVDDVVSSTVSDLDDFFVFLLYLFFFLWLGILEISILLAITTASSSFSISLANNIALNSGLSPATNQLASIVSVGCCFLSILVANFQSLQEYSITYSLFPCFRVYRFCSNCIGVLSTHNHSKKGCFNFSHVSNCCLSNYTNQFIAAAFKVQGNKFLQSI